MKIGEITPNQSIQKNLDVPKENRTADAYDFKSLFEEEINASTGSVQSSGNLAEEVTTVGAGPDMPPTWNVGMILNDREALTAAQAVGEKLDQMGQLLGDGSANLKRIDDMIRELSMESENLQDKVKDLPESHPLRQVGDELSVLAYVESVKWKRGDYL